MCLLESRPTAESPDHGTLCGAAAGAAAQWPQPSHNRMHQITFTTNEAQSPVTCQASASVKLKVDGDVCANELPAKCANARAVDRRRAATPRNSELLVSAEACNRNVARLGGQRERHAASSLRRPPFPSAPFIWLTASASKVDLVWRDSVSMDWCIEMSQLAALQACICCKATLEFDTGQQMSGPTMQLGVSGLTGSSRTGRTTSITASPVIQRRDCQVSTSFCNRPRLRPCGQHGPADCDTASRLRQCSPFPPQLSHVPR